MFVHACSGDHIVDHTDYVQWLGVSEELNMDALR
ncbi:MAG: hypothetical protein OSB69_17375 [Alphaproteobacteria bacterium]|nr:hypothetical protein [Alphaproteobacteria bacterium]